MDLYIKYNEMLTNTGQFPSKVDIKETYTYDYVGNRTSKTARRSDGNTEYAK